MLPPSTSNQPIYILSGPPGAGKTTVAHALLQVQPLGVHISVEDIQSWVVSGALPVTASSAKEQTEAQRQLRMARWTALQSATIYAEANFAVAIEDYLPESIFRKQYQQLLHGYNFHKIVLLPSVDAILSRSSQESSLIKQYHSELTKSNRPADGWRVIDSSDQSPEQTVAEILGQVRKPAKKR